ncbi:MAG: cupin [Acidobacteria bacterium SCN 69-37]|nr:MAG: cupin [Acidobacteria bacterium SCN 69-37]
MPSAEYRVSPADESIRLGPLSIRFLATGAETHGTLALFELIVPAAARLAAPPHSHDQYDETIYGLEGVLTWTVDDVPIEVRAGDALVIPRGAVHRFDNHGEVAATAVCVVTPAAIGPGFFRESAEVLNAAGGGPPDGARLAAIMAHHGPKPVPPPQG